MKDNDNQEIRVYLYDASGTDDQVELSKIDIRELDERKLLWINILRRDEAQVRLVVEHLELEDVPIGSIVSGFERPKIEKFAEFFRFCIHSVMTSEMGSPGKMPIDFIVGRNFIVTIHDGDVPYFKELRVREKGETHFGELDAESFVATLLDLHIVSYFQALDVIEKRVDKLDSKVLKRDLETDAFLSEMVSLRGDVSKLRRWLMPHREVMYAFLRPDFQQISQSDSLKQYETLSSHFENAVEAVESSRETVLSVFDLYATKSAQLMNIFIQRLTFITLILGAMSVIAGILGMNYKVDFFESQYGFWITIIGMLMVALSLTVFARLRRWI